MTLTGTDPSSGQPEVQTESGFLIQSGKSLAGSIALSGATVCPGLGAVSGTVADSNTAVTAGAVSASNVTITVNQIGQTVTLTGSAAKDGTSLTGDYSILAAGCGASAVGTFIATKIKSLSGSFRATFTSGEFSGLVYNFSGPLTQGPNTGMSYGTLSGTMTSTDAPCIQSFSIAGQVSGTSVVFNFFLASDGSAQGQYRGTTTTDGTTLTGTYAFLAQSNGCIGDAGTVTMAFQPSSI